MELRKNTTEDVDPNDPWARDKLGRKEVAEKYLTPVIASIRQPFVVSLHSEYGTGKTFFLQSWQADLKRRGFKVAYFNAWETDFSQDALSAFMASMKCQLSQNNEKTKQKFLDLAKKAGGFARSKLLPVIAKAAARKLVGAKGVEEFAEGLDELGVKEGELVDLLSATAVEALEAQEASEAAMVAFKRYLQTIVSEISDEYTGVNEDRWETEDDLKKVIVFVDELDRCRPTYAVEVLECIKHLFAVEGMVFVLAIDDEQIRNAISSVYGSKLDGDGYLRKFIDWRFRIPEPDKYRFCKFLLGNFFHETGNGNHTKVIEIEVTAGIAVVADVFNLSLREIQQAYSLAALVLKSNQGMSSKTGLALGVAAALYDWDQQYLREIVNDFEAANAFLLKVESGLKNQSLRESHVRVFGGQRMFLVYFVRGELLEKLEEWKIDGADAENKSMQQLSNLITPSILKSYEGFSFNLDVYDQSVMEIYMHHVSGAAAISA